MVLKEELTSIAGLAVPKGTETVGPLPYLQGGNRFTFRNNISCIFLKYWTADKAKEHSAYEELIL
jgi:hypothetical protein